MQIKFIDIKLYNFLSYKEVYYKFNDGITLVSGINNYTDDGSSSNGSGKSAIFEAILWVITGETSRGIKDIRNIYNIDEGAYVELSLNIDNDLYFLIRSKEHKKLKTNLKIYINNEDKSGKTLKDSEKLLQQYLPDLNKQLLTSIIILSQGLPDKFSANTPSKRKEILEQLTKSDYMIEDLKNRLQNRLKFISSKIREFEDSDLQINTQQNMLNQQLETCRNKLNDLSDFDSISSKIEATQMLLDETNRLLKIDQIQLNTYIESININQKDLQENILKKNNLKNTIRDIYASKIDKHTNDLISLNSEKKLLEQQIYDIDSIIDVCPTCKQKIIGISKPDSTDIKNNLQKLISNIDRITLELKQIKDDANLEYLDKVKEIDTIINTENTDISNANLNIKLLEETISKYQNDINNYTMTIVSLNEQLNNYTKNKQILEQEISNIKLKLDKLKEDKLYINSKLEYFKRHLSILNSINSLITRDFRGILLSNIIDYMCSKSIYYSNYLFGTNQIQIFLEGNNIEISYLNKLYNSLSGGEKQKVDIIIQLVLRDMLAEYFNIYSNLIVFDEITDNLDNLACQKIFDLILNISNNIDSIYIISHHTKSLDIPYDNELVVIKNSQGFSEIATNL